MEVIKYKNFPIISRVLIKSIKLLRNFGSVLEKIKNNIDIEIVKKIFIEWGNAGFCWNIWLEFFKI